MAKNNRSAAQLNAVAQPSGAMFQGAKVTDHTRTSKTKKVFKSLSIDQDLYAAAKAAAATEDRSFSYIVSRAVSRDLACAATGAVN